MTRTLTSLLLLPLALLLVLPLDDDRDDTSEVVPVLLVESVDARLRNCGTDRGARIPLAVGVVARGDNGAAGTVNDDSDDNESSRDDNAAICCRSVWNHTHCHRCCVLL